MIKRDNMHRCPVCMKLSPDEDCIQDEIEGLQCPNLCVPVVEQPPYELPING